MFRALVSSYLSCLADLKEKAKLESSARLQPGFLRLQRDRHQLGRIYQPLPPGEARTVANSRRVSLLQRLFPKLKNKNEASLSGCLVVIIKLK
jgi:hypothetical protein